MQIKKGIKLNLKEIIIENTITEYHEEKKCVINNISELKPEIIKLIDINFKNEKLDIVFNMKNSYKSPLMKEIERKSKEIEKILIEEEEIKLKEEEKKIED